MFKINLWDFPSKIKQDVAYILYYTFHAYPLMLIATILVSRYGTPTVHLSDYTWLWGSLLFAAMIGYTFWWITPSPEKQRIKRRHFVSGLLYVLSDKKQISIKNLVKHHAYSVFGSKKIALEWNEYAKVLIVLINLWIIKLINEKSFQNECHEFDFDLFVNNIDEMEFRLNKKDYDLDALVTRTELYLF